MTPDEAAERIAILTEDLRREREFRSWEHAADAISLYVLTCSRCHGEFLVKRCEEPYRTTRAIVGKILDAMRKAETRRDGDPVPTAPRRIDRPPDPDDLRPDPPYSGEEPYRLSDLVPGGG